MKMQVIGFVFGMSFFVSSCSVNSNCPPQLCVSFKENGNERVFTGIVINKDASGTFYTVAITGAEPKLDTKFLRDRLEGTKAIKIVPFTSVTSVGWIDCKDLPKI